MMPGIIISSIFSEQMGLLFRAFPSQDQLAGAEELLHDAPHWLGLQISAADLPGSARSCLLARQQTALNQPLDRMMTDTTDASSFIQAHPLRIR